MKFAAAAFTVAAFVLFGFAWMRKHEPVAPPTNLRVAGAWDASTGKQTDVLKWDPVEGASSYNLYVFDTKTATVSGSNIWVVPSAQWKTDVEYKVTAIVGGNESIPSQPTSTIGAVKPGTVLGAMTLTAAKNVLVEAQWNRGKPRNIVSWQGRDTSATYRIYRDNALIADGIWHLYYIDANVTAGTTYKYRITSIPRPTKVPSEAPSSPEVSVTTRSSQVPPGGTVTVTKKTPNDDSCLVEFSAVAGAKDYRIYKVGTVGIEKYSGGSLSIEVNAVDPIESYVIEAVDKLGPFQRMDGFHGPGGVTPVGHLIMTNGHGDPSNLPQVLATSAPFKLTTSPRSLPGAQSFFETWHSVQPFGAVLPDSRIFKRLNGDAATPKLGDQNIQSQQNNRWTVNNYLAEMVYYKPIFIMNEHMMNLGIPGGVFGSNVPLGVNYASTDFLIRQTFDFSGGKVLHATMEVDAHLPGQGRRWLEVFIVPGGEALLDPAVSTSTPKKPTDSGRMYRWKIMPSTHHFQAWQTDSANPTRSKMTEFIGPNDRGATPFHTRRDDFNGTVHNLDKRNRFDIYISASRVKLYENGQCKADKPLPYPGFDKATVHFVHQYYHFTLQRQEMINNPGHPADYFLNLRPFADERHWDNMGAEVLTAFP